jgi:hypothetical protein
MLGLLGWLCGRLARRSERLAREARREGRADAAIAIEVRGYKLANLAILCGRRPDGGRWYGV